MANLEDDDRILMDLLAARMQLASAQSLLQLLVPRIEISERPQPCVCLVRKAAQGTAEALDAVESAIAEIEEVTS